MTSRTVVDSVSKASGPPSDLPALEAGLQALRSRYPGAVFARYLAALPDIAESAHIAPSACLVGAVRLAEDTSVWFGCVLRGDVNRIELAARSNLQDGSVVHVGDRDPCLVGEDVVIGHRAVIHGCTIEAACLIGIQATILDGARIGHGSVIGAGCLVTAGTIVPPHSLVLGTPGKVVRTLTPADEDFHRNLAAKYTRLAHNHRFG